ncbi:MAG: hypothetical protein AAGM67_16325, partial [Bacteroidota bacterium]
MHRIFRAIQPRFFRQIDRRLLLNRPGLWATKIHFALLFGILGLILSALFVGMMPISHEAVPNPWIYLLLMAAPAILAFGFWIWQVSLFRPVKAFGEAGSKNDLRDQGIYILVLAMVCLLPAWHGYQVSQKIADSIPDEELVSDLNQLAQIHPFLHAALGNQSAAEDARKGLMVNGSNFKYYAFKHAESNLESYSTFKALRELEKTEILTLIDRYLILLDKYSSTTVNKKSEEIYGQYVYLEVSSEAEAWFSNQAVEEAEQNLHRIQKAKIGQDHFFQDEAYRLLLFIFLYTFGLLLIGLEAGGKAFLLAAVAGVGLLVVGVFA